MTPCNFAEVSPARPVHHREVVVSFMLMLQKMTKGRPVGEEWAGHFAVCLYGAGKSACTNRSCVGPGGGSLGSQSRSAI